MTNPQPPPLDRLGITERAVGLVQQITLRNVLVLALLVIIGAPAIFLWKFATDRDFREEWDSYVRVTNMDVPCLVFTIAEVGGRPRSVVSTAYDVEPRYERLIGYRSPGIMSKEQVAAACELIHLDVKDMRVLLGTRDLESRTSPTGEGK